MRALVFDGSRVGETEQEPVRTVIEEELSSTGWDVETLQLRDIEIAPCIGCFGCWVQTPGICVIDDAGREVTEKLVASDLLVIVTSGERSGSIGSGRAGPCRDMLNGRDILILAQTFL